MRKKARYRTNFGTSASLALAEARMTQSEVASAVGVSPAYVNHTFTGRKPAAAKWVDMVADVTGASPARRTQMHRGAAQDAGFRLDLDYSEEA